MKTKYSRRFLKDVKLLRKKFHLIEQDLRTFIDKLESGNISYPQKLEGFREFDIFKARLRNSSVTSGKSGGFRVIYYSKVANDVYYLLTIYSKTQKTNISKKEIIHILEQESLTL